MAKFSIGERVMVNTASDKIWHGHIGTVIPPLDNFRHLAGEEPEYLVEFDKPVVGYFGEYDALFFYSSELLPYSE